MNINWFPGHMMKAVREMEEKLSLVDAVVYVTDSRAINSSSNPVFNELVGNKPVLYIFNKCDLVDRNDLNKWINKFHSEGKEVIPLVGTSLKADVVINALKKACLNKIQKFENKGAKISIRAMVIGIPNTGKSTIINSLIGKGKAITGNRPGVTRSQVWYSINGVDLLDTPGTLWGKFTDQNTALHLAYIGSIKDDVLDKQELSKEFIKEAREKYPELIKTRYKLDDIPSDMDDALEKIAKSRGFIVKGGEYDLERTASTILDDFRSGKLGKMMLEKA